MKGKTLAKFVLDAVMIVVTMLLYNSHVLGWLGWHEAVGIAILAVFLVHCLLNAKWVAGVTRRLFAAGVPLRTRVSWWVDAVMALAFVAIVVSGLFFSKALFKDLAAWGAGTGVPWRYIHTLCSGISLIALGVHHGLYWDKIKAMMGRAVRPPARLMRPVAYVAMAVVLGFGGYYLATSNFLGWMIPALETGGHGHGGGGRGEATTEARAGAEAEAGGEDADGTESRADAALEDGAASAATASAASGESEAAEGRSGGEDSRHSPQLPDPLNMLTVFWTYFTIFGLFAIATYWLDKLIGARRMGNAKAATGPGRAD